MRPKTFLIRCSALVSALALVSSCSGRDADARLNLSAPPAIERAQAEDQRPALPIEAGTSEAAYEGWISDVFDWADRRNLLAYRWCQLWNRTVAGDNPVDCGPAPQGVEE